MKKMTQPVMVGGFNLPTPLKNDGLKVSWFQPTPLKNDGLRQLGS